MVLGQLMLLASGAVFLFTTPLLIPDGNAWRAIATISAVMLAAPAALTFMGGEVSPYARFWVLAFTVTGLTRSARTNWLALVPAVPAYVLTDGTSTAEFGVRVIIAVAVSMLVAQLLVRMTSRQRALAGHLRTEAHTDALTGVANRRDLDDRLLGLAAGDSVVICDLDHFKALNDRLGHAARYGAEELGLVLPATTAAQAGAVTDRLRERWTLLQPGTTFSAGTAMADGCVSAADLVAAADAALYAAKAEGRNCTRTAQDSTHVG